MTGNAEFRNLELPDRSNRYRNEAGEIVFREVEIEESKKQVEEKD